MEKRGSYPQEMDCFRVARVCNWNAYFSKSASPFRMQIYGCQKNHMQFSLMGLNATSSYMSSIITSHEQMNWNLLIFCLLE
jgi:hypothetical protein